MIVGLVAFATVVLVKRTTLAFSLGTTTSAIAVELKPGEEVCQQPIAVPGYGTFDRVVIQLGTYAQLGPALDVTVRDTRRRVLAQRRLGGGYGDIDVVPRHLLRFGRLIRGDGLAVCVSNLGTRRVAIYGSGDNASRSSTALLEGRRLDRDMNLEFRRPGRTYASLMSSMLRRAVLFRSPRISATAYAVLLGALLLGAVVALFAAVRGLD